MAELLKKTETKNLGKTETKNIETAHTEKLSMSEARAKKINHSYKVKDPENSIVLKLKD